MKNSFVFLNGLGFLFVCRCRFEILLIWTRYIWENCNGFIGFRYKMVEHSFFLVEEQLEFRTLLEIKMFEKVIKF